MKDHSYQLDMRNHYARHVLTKVTTSLIAPKLQLEGCIIRPRDVVIEMHTNHGIRILYTKA